MKTASPKTEKPQHIQKADTRNRCRPSLCPGTHVLAVQAEKSQPGNRRLPAGSRLGPWESLPLVTHPMPRLCMSAGPGGDVFDQR